MASIYKEIAMNNGLNLPFAGTLATDEQVVFSITNPADPPRPTTLHPVITAIAGNAVKGIGVSGTSQTGSGVAGNANSGVGVFGSSQAGDRVLGLSTSNAHAGVSATNDSGGFGVWGRGTPGGHFESKGGDGVVGLCASNAHAGVSATNDSGGFGVWARGTPAGHFEGGVEINGNLTILSGGDVVLSDFAEDFDAADAEVEPGTVIAIAQDGTLRPTNQPSDKRVAGVVSGAGDYRPAIVLDKQSQTGNRRPIALVGKVYCKVDASNGAIEIGDLLTTSPSSGHAMKAQDPIRAFGAVIGKALKPLKEGRGLIPILVALQ
jgi:hypothetical protein